MVQVEVDATEHWRCAHCSERRYSWNEQLACSMRMGGPEFNSHSWRPVHLGVRFALVFAGELRPFR